jgi:predicted metal-binding membrane protein
VPATLPAAEPASTPVAAPAPVAARTAAPLHAERAAVLVAGAAWSATLILHGVGGIGHGHAGTPDRGPVAALAGWALMCVAMMVPVALPAVRHVAANSLRRRRRRAAAQFLVAYVAVWVAFGALVLPLLDPLAARFGPVLLPVALLTAACWQVLPAQRHFLRACHRTVPLPPRGRLAVAGCLRFGTRHGLACLGVCWPFMLAMAALSVTASGVATVIWMAVLSGLSATAKLVPRRHGWSTPLAVGLAVFALALSVT